MGWRLSVSYPIFWKRYAQTVFGHFDNRSLGASSCYHCMVSERLLVGPVGVLNSPALPHTLLRHTSATRLATECNTDVITVKQLGRWKRMEMVERYVNPSDEHKIRAINSIQFPTDFTTPQNHEITELPQVAEYKQVGTWRSLVAYLNGVQGVASSNLAVPTK